MALNFAPYQSSPPESERAKSPPPRSPPASPRQKNLPPVRNLISSVADQEDPWAAARAQNLPPPSRYDDYDQSHSANPGTRGYTDLDHDDDDDDHAPPSYQHDYQPRYNDYIGRDALAGGGVTHGGRQLETGLAGGGAGGSVFETSVGLPLWAAACLAYVVLPPVGAIVLLLLERKSDYVRFHAWQSTLLFGALAMVHVIFSWSAFVSWVLFVVDLVLGVYLTYGAWRHADTLDRVEIAFFGRLASSFVDDD